MTVRQDFNIQSGLFLIDKHLIVSTVFLFLPKTKKNLIFKPNFNFSDLTNEEKKKEIGYLSKFFVFLFFLFTKSGAIPIPTLKMQRRKGKKAKKKKIVMEIYCITCEP